MSTDIEARKVIQATLDDRITNGVTSDVRSAQIILALEASGFRIVRGNDGAFS